jgi:hypothetical protein
MNFFAWFGRTPKRFVSEEVFQKNLVNQVSMTPATLGELRKLGVSIETSLKLEFFFYTNTSDKAATLASVLSQRNYEVHHEKAAIGNGQFVITGWTQSMKMEESVVAGWVKEMWALGYEHDCEFDGWGTSPDQ